MSQHTGSMPIPKKGPYPPTNASLGGVPTKGVDIPISAVFLFLFLISAITHMTILQLNQKKGHKFIFSGLCFGFSASRVAATSLRIAWACHPTNINLAIASQIFVSAGVVLLFVCNMFFAQRIIRASHPHFGWHRAVSTAFTIYTASLVAVLIALITTVILSFFTLSNSKKGAYHTYQVFASTYFAVYAFMPIPMVIVGLILPRPRPEKFGSGRYRTKIAILLASTVLLALGAGFRAGGLYRIHPRDQPPIYFSRAFFYLFDFSIDITVLLFYAFIRIDQRFHVPNGSKGPGDYNGTSEKASIRIRSEEEVFDDAPEEEAKDLETGRQTKR